MGENNSPATLYDKLSRRQENMIRNMDEYFDVYSKFTKEESKACISKHQETRALYKNQLVRYARETHRKQAVTRRSKLNSPYLIYADKIINKLGSG